jgi:hypothetical protein
MGFIFVKVFCSAFQVLCAKIYVIAKFSRCRDTVWSVEALPSTVRSKVPVDILFVPSATRCLCIKQNRLPHGGTMLRCVAAYIQAIYSVLYETLECQIFFALLL